MANAYLDAVGQDASVELEQEQDNPYLATAQAPAENPYLTASAAPPPKELSLGGQIVEGLKDQGRGLVQIAKYLLEGPGLAFGEKGWIQLNKPGIIRDRELAAAGDAEAANRVRLGEMGTALVASTMGATAAARGLGQTFLGSTGALGTQQMSSKAVRFLAAEAIGGGIYGAIDPGDRERTDAIVQDAITFPIAGGVLNGVFKGAKGGWGWIGSKLLGKPTKDRLATATKEEAQAIGKEAYSFMQKLGLDENASNKEVAHAQAVAVEQAVDKLSVPSLRESYTLPTTAGAKPTATTKPAVASIADIQPPITKTESLFPPITPEHRAALKVAFGNQYKIYEKTYNDMRLSDDAVKYERNRKLLAQYEDGLTAEQRTKLSAFGKPVWEVEVEAALKQGDQLAAADIALEQAVNETPIKAIASSELQMDAEKLKSVLEQGRKNAADFVAMDVNRRERLLNDTQQGIMQTLARNAPERPPLSPESQAWVDEQFEIMRPKETADEIIGRAKRLANAFTIHEDVRKAVAANDTEGLATKLALTNKLNEQSLADVMPAQIDRPKNPTAITNAAVLYNRADDATKAALEEEGKSIAQRFLSEESGAMVSSFGRRLGARAVLGTGAAFAESNVNEDNSGFQNTSLRAVAGVLALGAVLPGPNTKALLNKYGLTRNMIKMFDLREVATKEGQEGMHIFHSVTGESRAKAVLAANDLRKIVKTHDENIAFTYAIDEGAAAPEFTLLTTAQQNEALSLRAARRTLGQVLESQGLVDDWVQSYYRQILPKETADAWLTQHETFKKAGLHAQQADFERMRTILAWAKKNDLPMPVVNAAEANAAHILQAGELQAIAQVKDYFTGVKLLQDVPGDGILPNGWRRISPKSLGEKMAPDDVATVIDRMYSHSFSIPIVDAIRGAMMKSIMIFPWEHGVNLARGVAAIDPTGRQTFRAIKAIDNADPVVLEVSKYSQLFKQPDLLNAASERLVKNLRWAGMEKLIKGHEWGDRKLWESWAPAVGIVAWTTEMRKWGQKTGYKYLRGSPEYEAAARSAGRYADDAMGKIPDLVQSPKLAAGMRLLLFSPAWLRTRMSILAHAAGDAQSILSGELNPKDAKYLQYKMKSVALGVAFTWLLSKAMSGEDPEFNPNTTKLYAKSPFYDDKGRQMGVDLVGWWQDDLKLFNEPWMFLENRLNPLLRTVNQTVTGRDVFGNELDGVERWENLVDQLGPPAVIPSALVRTMKGEMTEAEALRSGSEFLAVGNVSALPHYRDVMIAKMSEKILRLNGLSVHRDNIYELSKYMRQNIAMSGSWYGDNIQSYLVYKRKSSEHNFPLTSAWRKRKQIIMDTFEK